MRKLVMASMLCLAAVIGSERDASALSLFGIHLGGRDASAQSASGNSQRQAQYGQAPVINVQNSDAEVRLQQLEDQMRQLNGRVEEMSYQLLQMQETIRKAQEDNEFRFQQLEKRGGGAPAPAAGAGGTMKKSEADVPSQGGGGQQDDVAGVISGSQNGNVASSRDNGSGKAPSELGSIQFDQSGDQVGSSMTGTNNGSGAPPSAGGSSSGSQTASLGSENDQYRAAYGHVLSGDYSVAEQEFRQYLDSYPSSSRASDANFWLGEALYSQGKYNEAAKTFLNAHQKYSGSEKAPEMLLKLGMSLAALDNKDTACATLREVTKRYPKASKAVTSKVASEEKRLAC
ncbi:tol-pal system protein YbgF [Rhizobium sp. NPDC090279]|uniref:tol-pal system protein YbgF n=1 Tax=Rhizobium sp. NPDC090279 TaxID=3364499 RepID=UPI00383BA861